MDASSELFTFMRFLATQVPEMIVLFLGVVLSLARWRQQPKAALLAFLGFGSLIAIHILSTAAFIFQSKVLDFFANPDGWELYLTITTVVRSFLTAGSYLLLVFVLVAATRAQRAGPTRPDPQYAASGPSDSVN